MPQGPAERAVNACDVDRQGAHEQMIYNAHAEYGYSLKEIGIISTFIMPRKQNG